MIKIFFLLALFTISSETSEDPPISGDTSPNPSEGSTIPSDISDNTSPNPSDTSQNPNDTPEASPSPSPDTSPNPTDTSNSPPKPTPSKTSETTQTSEETTTTKPTPPTANACKGRVGFILDPNSKCKNYYTCSKQGSQIVISQESSPCSFGVFDEETSQCVYNTYCPKACEQQDCDHDNLPDCGNRKYPFQLKSDCTKYTRCVDDKEETIECGPNEYAVLSGGELCRAYDISNPPKCIKSPQQICTSAGYIPNLNDCRAYHRCSYNRFEDKIVLASSGSCPNGYYFNKQKKMCTSCKINTESCNYC